MRTVSGSSESNSPTQNEEAPLTAKETRGCLLDGCCLASCLLDLAAVAVLVAAFGAIAVVGRDVLLVRAGTGYRAAVCAKGGGPRMVMPRGLAAAVAWRRARSTRSAVSSVAGSLAPR